MKKRYPFCTFCGKRKETHFDQPGCNGQICMVAEITKPSPLESSAECLARLEKAING